MSAPQQPARPPNGRTEPSPRDASRAARPPRAKDPTEDRAVTRAASRLFGLFVPAGLTGDPLRRSRILVGGCLLLTVAILLLIFRRLTFEGYDSLTIELMLAGLGVSVGAPLLLRASGSHRVAGTVAVLGAVVLLTVGGYVNGGFDTLALYWFPAVPLVASFFVGPPLAFVVAVELVVELLVFYLLHRAGHPFPHRPPIDEYQKFYLVGASAAVVFSAVLAWLYESAWKKAQRALGDSEERYALAVRGARDVLWDWDRATGQVYVSPRLQELFGVTLPAPCTVDDVLALVHPDDAGTVGHALRQHVRDGAKFDVECRLLVRGGEVRWVDARGEAVFDRSGAAVRMAGSLHDITRLKQAERELTARAAELERSNKDLEQFAYAASHDLREPLRTVSSFAQLLAHRYQGQLDQSAEEYIRTIVDGAHRMNDLVRDLLEYSRISRSNGEVTNVSLSLPLDAALGDLRSLIEESGARISATELPIVRGNLLQLTRLLQNLLSNAIKFRPPDRAPEIHVSAERQGEEVRVEVSDDGIGISPEHQERIFEIFQRLHTRDRYPGTGIGLAICKRIVLQHGGRIWVEAKEGPGTTFVFTLPAAESPPGTPGHPHDRRTV